ncbi:hypothetical protein HG531_004721 [Fusarium graminearum]|nr:hypothetical protein HG531_004721 [Fusarium graminearum]
MPLAIYGSTDRHAEVPFVGEKVDGRGSVDNHAVWDASKDGPYRLNAPYTAGFNLSVHDIIAFEADNRSAIDHGVVVLKTCLTYQDHPESIDGRTHIFSHLLKRGDMFSKA